MEEEQVDEEVVVADTKCVLASDKCKPLSELEKGALNLFNQRVLQHPLRRLGRQVEGAARLRRCNFDMIWAARTLRDHP